MRKITYIREHRFPFDPTSYLPRAMSRRLKPGTKPGGTDGEANTGRAGGSFTCPGSVFAPISNFPPPGYSHIELYRTAV